MLIVNERGENEEVNDGGYQIGRNMNENEKGNGIRK